MKTAVIFSGNEGTCEIVANMIKKGLNHEVDVFDTSKRFYIDFDEYDNFILGTNVRFGRLNNRFKKCFKIMKKYTTNDQNYYCYICGAYKINAEKDIEDARNLIDVTCDYYFVGGEVNISKMKGFNKILGKKFAKNFSCEDAETPELIYENIDKLIESINNEDKE